MATPAPEAVKAHIAHIKKAWDSGITVGINPPGLLRTAVELADVRTPETGIAAAVFAAEAVRHLLSDSFHAKQVSNGLAELVQQAISLSESLQMFQVTGRRL